MVVPSQLVGNVLSPAVRFWLHSQADQVEDLAVEIGGSNRQLLTGEIPEVAVAAERVIYRGIHLSALRLNGRNIRVNLGQVLRGKPLQLLETVTVGGALRWSEQDLNASIGSPLWQQGLADFLSQLLAILGEPPQQEPRWETLRFQFEPERLVIDTHLILAGDRRLPLALRTGIRIRNGSELEFFAPEWLAAPGSTGWELDALDGYRIPLGDHVRFDQFDLTPQGLACQGEMLVIPAAADSEMVEELA
jgi:hypothetical protein